MKKLFLSIAIIFCLQVSAQTPQTNYVVTSIAQMKVYYGNANRMHVTATNEDYISCPTCTSDEITIYAGAGGRNWKKFSDASKLNKADSSTGGYYPYATNPKGYLTSIGTIDTNNIFNFYAKVRSLFSATPPLTYTNGIFGIPQSGTASNGYLTSTDWNTFSSKQPAGSYLSSVDTNNISNFFAKVRSLFSGVSPIVYNSVLGQFTFDTSLHHTKPFYDGLYGSLATQQANTTNIAANTSALQQKFDSLRNNAGVLEGRKNGTFVPQFTLPAGGNGSVSGLTPKPVLFGSAAGTIQQDTTFAIDSLSPNQKALRIGTIVSEDYAGKSIVFCGNSVTFGSNATNFYRYSTVATRLLAGWKLVEDNRGSSGTTVTNGLSTIPTKTTAMRFLSLAYGINETPDSTTFSHTLFVTGYKKMLDSAIARGWSAKDILVNSIAGTSYGMTSNPTYRQIEFNAVMDSLHNVYGTMYADVYNPLLIPEYSYLTKGQLHPDSLGHEIMGYIVAGAIKGSFNMQRQKLAVNDSFQFSKANYKNLYYINKGQVLGYDSLGNVGHIHQLPVNFGTQGRFFTNGAIINRTAIIPTVGYDSTKDILMGLSAKIIQASSTPAASGDLTIMNTSGTSTWHNGYSGGSINLNVSGGSNGGSITGLSINNSGVVNMPNGLTMNSVSLASFTATNGTHSGGFYANNSGNTEVRNGTSTGLLKFSMSNRTTAGVTQMMQLDATGGLKLQQGGTFTENSLAILDLNSTTKSFLTPRMTTTQRDAMSGILSSTITTPGSGQTNGTYTVTVSGTVTGAIVNAVVAGGTISSVTIVYGGNAASGTVTGTVSAGGTPGLVTFTIGVPEASEIYNLTTHTKNYYNGSSWISY